MPEPPLDLTGDRPYLVRDPNTNLIHVAAIFEEGGYTDPISRETTWCGLDVWAWMRQHPSTLITCLECWQYGVE